MNHGANDTGIRRLSAKQIRSLAETQLIQMTLSEAKDIKAFVDAAIGTIENLDRFNAPANSFESLYGHRHAGHRPSTADNPYNSFIHRCDVRRSAIGKLAGKRIGLKDNIRLAGVPMTNASRSMEHYVPSIDATVASRLLDAGGVIVGKTNMDKFSMGGTSETGDYGAVLNPYNTRHSAGGSSGGSGAAVAASEVDIAVGVDQAGSARIPAAWCGVTSIKATHGLVPSFGITYVDHTIDYVCPLARTVTDLALALEVMAGADPKDPQWVHGSVQTANYSEAIGQPITGLRVGIIREAFSWPDSEADVNEAVQAGIDRLASSGAITTSVSIPWWQSCRPILSGIFAHTNSAMIESNMEGYWRGGACDPHWQSAFGKARRDGADFPLLLKVQMIVGKYLREDYFSTYFSKAQNARLAIRADLDRVFEQFDVLVTPTVQTKAVKLTTEQREGLHDGRGSVECNKNCCPLNLTGHPALTLPCGLGDSNLPIGIQLIGRHWDEKSLFRAAAQIENSAWPAPPAL